MTAALRRSARVDHALRAVIALDGSHAGRPCKLVDLLERAPAPQKFLAMILADLRQGGIVGSARGSHGGYWLDRPLAAITVLAVVEALGPDEGEGGAVPPGAIWGAIDEQVATFLGGLTMADLAAGRLASTG